MKIVYRDGKIFGIREKSDILEERKNQRQLDPYEQYLVNVNLVRRIEKQKFQDIPKCGRHAHAYKKQYDNFTMLSMRQEGKSLQEIAKRFGCSKSTVRNRLNKLGCMEIDIAHINIDTPGDITKIRLNL